MELSILDEYGIDWRSGVVRCLNDQKFYVEILKLFLEDDCMARADLAFEQENRYDLFCCMHEFKGECANLAFTRLLDSVTQLVELLRDNSDADKKEVDAAYSSVRAFYSDVCEGIMQVLDT